MSSSIRTLSVVGIAAALYGGCATAGSGDSGSTSDDGGGSGDDSGQQTDSGKKDSSRPQDTGSDDTGGDDTGTGDDSPTGFDAGSCTPVTPSPPPPAHGGAQCSGGTGNCYPHDETAFSPSWVPPVGAKQNKCSSQQISDYYTACFGSSATQATCQTWETGNAACFACLVTDSTKSQYGALVTYGLVESVNLAGCLALAEPCNSACAQAMQGFVQCSNKACDPTQNSTICPVTSQATFATYQTCVQSSQTCTACSGFAQSDSSCEQQVDVPAHAAYQYCYGGKTLQTATFQDLLNAVGMFMCGS